MLRLFFSLLLLSMTQTSFADICGRSDDRQISNDPKVGRLSKLGNNQGCVVALVGPNCAVTAGSCLKSADFAEFNTPLSIGGIPQPSKEEDQYIVDKQSWEFDYGSIGKEWAVIKFKKNAVSGRFPGEAQGFYSLATYKSHKDDDIRIVSYGTTSLLDYPHPQNDIRNYAQQTAYGKIVKAGILLLPTIIEHNADTAWGGLGSPIINEKTDELIGISTHGGCETSKTNSGTLFDKAKAFKAAVAACLKQ